MGGDPQGEVGSAPHLPAVEDVGRSSEKPAAWGLRLHLVAAAAESVGRWLRRGRLLRRGQRRFFLGGNKGVCDGCGRNCTWEKGEVRRIRWDFLIFIISFPKCGAKTRDTHGN